MTTLSWHNAGDHHRQALSEFVCTDPPKRTYDRNRGRHHPRPWELEVQSHLRGLRTPAGPGEALALGLDEHGVAAAAHFGFDDTRSQFMIWSVARAHRCSGLGYGREALEVSLAVMKATKETYDLDLGVFTYVDPRNKASRNMVQAVGFTYLNMYDGYEGWVRDV